MTISIQGVAAEFSKCFVHGDEVWFLMPGCFGSPASAQLMLNHDGKSIATADIFAGDELLIFRCDLPDSFSEKMVDHTDEINAYVGVSTGFNITNSERISSDGVSIKIIHEATLVECSLLDRDPAIDSTYGRIVSQDSCGTLRDDYDRIKLVGRYIGVHRKIVASENDGKVSFKNVLSSYDAAANRFTRSLAALA